MAETGGIINLSCQKLLRIQYSCSLKIGRFTALYSTKIEPRLDETAVGGAGGEARGLRGRGAVCGLDDAQELPRGSWCGGLGLGGDAGVRGRVGLGRDRPDCGCSVAAAVRDAVRDCGIGAEVAHSVDAVDAAYGAADAVAVTSEALALEQGLGRGLRDDPP